MGKHKPGKGRTAKGARKGQLATLEQEFSKSPHSFVFSRGFVGRHVKELINDTRRLMEPLTARNLKVRKNNNLKDFMSVAGPLNVTHFMIFTKSSTSTYLRLARIPRGPTLTFKVHNYCLSRDIVSSLKKHNMESKQFLHHPLLVMNNFSGEGHHLKLITTMFQNLFSTINVNQVKLSNIRRCVVLNFNPETKLIDFRHYNIRVVPTGVSRGVKKIVNAKIPDLGKFKDVSEYLLKSGNLSESEAEPDGPHNEVILPQEVSSRGNMQAAKTAIRLTEIGPSLTLQLVKIEEGMCQGDVIFHEFVKKTAEEEREIKKRREERRKLKEQRKKTQEENVKRKKNKTAGNESVDNDGKEDENESEKEDGEEEDENYDRKEVDEESEEDESFSADEKQAKRKKRVAKSRNSRVKQKRFKKA